MESPRGAGRAPHGGDGFGGDRDHRPDTAREPAGATTLCTLPRRCVPLPLGDVLPCLTGCGLAIAECDLCRAFLAHARRAGAPGNAAAIMGEAALALRFVPPLGSA